MTTFIFFGETRIAIAILDDLHALLESKTFILASLGPPTLRYLAVLFSSFRSVNDASVLVVSIPC